MFVLRDEESVLNAVVRTKSEPIISKAPWKKFSFDRQVANSKAHGGKLFRKDTTDKDTIAEDIPEADTERVDDASTLVEDAELRKADVAESLTESGMDGDESNEKPRFSKTLAFSHPECDMASLVEHRRYVWDASDVKLSQSMVRHPSVQIYRLSTRYFDLSIHAHTTDGREISMNGDVLASYKDVSSILFTVKLSAYHYNETRLQQDLVFFASAVNDYHVLPAKVILFLDITDLDQSNAGRISDEIKRQFMQAGRAGASSNRIHVVVGEVDEAAAGTIFAVCNEFGRVQANKWGELTRWSTD